jgi:hypothetical protein
MENQKAKLATTISLVTILLIVIFVTYSFSPKIEIATNLFYAIAVTFILFGISYDMWHHEEYKNKSILDWFKLIGYGTLIIFGFFIIDIFIGKSIYPKLPFYLAATQHIGFIFTLACSSFLGVEVICTFRAIVLKLIGQPN